MKKPKYEKGNWQVTRNCCQSGNCFQCRHVTPLGKCVRVVQTDGVSKAWAEYVAYNWKQYDAVAEEMAVT